MENCFLGSFESDSLLSIPPDCRQRNETDRALCALPDSYIKQLEEIVKILCEDLKVMADRSHCMEHRNIWNCSPVVGQCMFVRRSSLELSWLIPASEMIRSHQRASVMYRLHLRRVNFQLDEVQNCRNRRRLLRATSSHASWKRQSSTHKSSRRSSYDGSLVVRTFCRCKTAFVVQCKTGVGMKIPSGVMIDWHARDASANSSCQQLCAKFTHANFAHLDVFHNSCSMIGIGN